MDFLNHNVRSHYDFSIPGCINVTQIGEKADWDRRTNNPEFNDIQMLG